MTVARYISADVRERAVIGGSRAGGEAPTLLERTAHIVWRDQAPDEESPAALAPVSPLSAQMLAAELRRKDSADIFTLPSSAYRVHAFGEGRGVDTDVGSRADDIRGRTVASTLAGSLFLREGRSAVAGSQLNMTL